jgi:hypothetical protein
MVSVSGDHDRVDSFLSSESGMLTWRSILSRRDWLRASTLIALCGTAAGLRAQEDAASRGFAVVELFTSEGCSSCPPADRNLADIQAAAHDQQQPVYVLSYHVDYWNDLGWEDPFSREPATRRQREYAGLFGGDRIYTPQMVINGTTEFVGSDRRRSSAEIALALSRPATGRIDVAATADRGRITVHGTAARVGGDELVVTALVKRHGEQSVTAGENAHRVLRHVNIVRDFRVAPVESGRPIEATFEAPAGFLADEYRVVVFTQARMGPMSAAADCEIREP